MKLRELLEHYSSRIEKIAESQLSEEREQGRIREMLAVLAKDVQYHIKRTDLLEAEQQRQARFINMTQGALKFMLGAGAIVGALAGFLKLVLH